MAAPKTEIWVEETKEKTELAYRCGHLKFDTIISFNVPLKLKTEQAKPQ